ncbi:MAG TPA: metalloregulator ArsR/SmtB family transcription factor [Fimbriimonadaceae bacterium]|nr:metalloregulator ArsR/SmtB family transcription factor [Fimbriimonadaceae bacterium]
MPGFSEGQDVFSAIAAPARRAMLARLAQREMPMGELAEAFEMSLPAVSQHLGVLKDAGLVASRKAGRHRIYRLNPEPLKAVSDWVNTYEAFWTGKMAALGEYLEKSE